MTASWAIGALVILGRAAPGTTGFAVPWRYWGVAAGLLVECSGIYYRITLWNTPFNVRDLTFLAINVCIAVAATGTLNHRDVIDSGKETS